MSEQEEISDEELRALCRAVLTRYNIDFTHYETRSFKRRVKSAMNTLKMGNLMELWQKLLQDRDFVFDFIDAITVGMTSLFRDPKMWLFLKKDVMHQLRNHSTLRVWHMGCSTGEEAYSFGILLKESFYRGVKKAVATDLNRNSIEMAQSGRFPKVNHTQNERQYKTFNPVGNINRYTTLEGYEVIYDNKLVEHVDFKVQNVTKEMPDGKFNIIFCRNILIYFDENLKKRLLQELYDKLEDDGFLIIGFFDALIPLIDPTLFEFYDIEHKVFRKKRAL